jgi:hypothetical protein
MNLKSLFLGTAIIALFMNCETDSESDLRAPVPVLVKYNNSIKPIMDAKCTSCHNEYSNYSGTKNDITAILIRIQKNNGDPLLMPQNGPKLSQADINLFLKWQADGLLE